MKCLPIEELEAMERKLALLRAEHKTITAFMQDVGSWEDVLDAHTAAEEGGAVEGSCK